MTEQEQLAAEEAVLDSLAAVWNDFCKLPQEYEAGGHNDDTADFKFHLHALQNIVASRHGLRHYRLKMRKSNGL